MLCPQAAEHLRNAQQALKNDDINMSIKEISLSLQLIFESGELPDFVLTPYDNLPHDLNTLVDNLEEQ